MTVAPNATNAPPNLTHTNLNYQSLWCEKSSQDCFSSPRFYLGFKMDDLKLNPGTKLPQFQYNYGQGGLHPQGLARGETWGDLKSRGSVGATGLFPVNSSSWRWLTFNQPVLPFLHRAEAAPSAAVLSIPTILNDSGPSQCTKPLHFTKPSAATQGCSTLWVSMSWICAELHQCDLMVDAACRVFSLCHSVSVFKGAHQQSRADDVSSMQPGCSHQNSAQEWAAGLDGFYSSSFLPAAVSIKHKHSIRLGLIKVRKKRLFLSSSLFPLSYIPFFVKTCKDVEHSCPYCNQVLHTHKPA